MNILKSLFRNKIFLAGLLIPIIWQIVYFSIAIPAMNQGDARITNLKIAIVNEDQVLGKQIEAQLAQSLPFTIEKPDDMTQALVAMDDGDYSMVIHIADNFTAGLQQGNSRISYYVNQAVPGMAKQLMETTANNIDRTLNENAFNTLREMIRQKSVASLSQTGLPAASLAVVEKTLNRAFSSLTSTPVAGDILKVNDAGGFIKSAFPLYIFLTYFIGSVAMTFAHGWVYRTRAAGISRNRLFPVTLVINLLYSLVLPGIVVFFAAVSGISFSHNIAAVWLLLAAGLFTFLSLFQMFFRWLGLPGTAVMVLLLFPLQLVASGLMYPREILPAFYNITGDYLPATYFGNGIIKVFFGTLPISAEIGILLLMSGIFVTVSAMALFRKVKYSGKSPVQP